jgi:hypothetical protein
MKMFDSPGVTNPLELARKRLAAAEKSVEDAKEEWRSAKRKRKEAKLAARRAKKQIKRTREELDDAQRALSQEKANDALRVKIARGRKRTTSRRVKLSQPRPKAKRGARRVSKKTKPAAETSEPIVTETVPVESIPAGDFQISQAAPEMSLSSAGTEQVLEPTEQVPPQ